MVDGYSQMFGIDYHETSPAIKLTFVHLVILFVATHHWPLHQLDIKNAFLHGILDEKVYMKQSLGFVAQGEYGRVCHRRKSLYRLKQYPRALFRRFALVVQGFGLRRSHKDLSVFFQASSGKTNSFTCLCG